jgi:putative two-component system response regulator
MSERVVLAEETPVILLVDDTKENLTIIGQILRPHYRVRVANSGARALEVAQTAPMPDLILLDVVMPDMDGYQVLEALQQNPALAAIPVIFVSALDADQDEARGLALGAVDYVTKPVVPALLLARIHAQLELKWARDRLAGQNAFLDAEVRRRMVENETIKEVSLFSLAKLAEKRDNETGNHLYRTQAYIEVLMRKLMAHPRFAPALSDPEYQQRISRAAPLHDIGKVGIPDSILLKPGKLTAEEFEIMKTHAAIGADALREAIDRAHTLQASHQHEEGASFEFLEIARQIAGGHHEKWNGSGYPDGLAGDSIPLPARLMALADVFDALISRRHYKPAFALDDAVGLIQQGAGTHFDPDVVAAFLASIDEFVHIAEQYQDHNESCCV